MTRRSQFTFEFLARQLVEASSERVDHHTARKVWWEQEYEKAVQKAESQGLRVERYEITGGERAQVVVDPTLSERVSECWQAVQRHRKAAEEYERWRRAFEIADSVESGTTFALDVDDVAYFNL